jgi:hypothetical protein
MLTNYFHLVLRLRMSGAILLLSLYAFMSWREQLYFFYDGVGFQTLKCQLHVVECAVALPNGQRRLHMATARAGTEGTVQFGTVFSPFDGDSR